MSDNFDHAAALTNETERILDLMDLTELQDLRNAVDVAILDRIDHLKRLGAPWKSIGAILGITGAAAHARYATGRHLIEANRRKANEPPLFS